MPTNQFVVSEEAATDAELKVLHRTIKKIKDDIERISFNTAVSTFMICVNELIDLKCNKRAILQPLCILISPFAPHIAEELWSLLGNTNSISYATFPEFNEGYLVESAFTYPVSINGKLRSKISFPIDMETAEMEKQLLSNEDLQKWLNGQAPKKIIIIKSKIINIVL